MKSKILILVALCTATCILAACGGNDNGSSSSTTPTPPPTTSNVQALDTAQVLALAQVTSETSTPFAVNGGALVLVDTSENSSPITVDHQ